MCHSQGQMIDILCSTEIKYCKESSPSSGIKQENFQPILWCTVTTDWDWLKVRISTCWMVPVQYFQPVWCCAVLSSPDWPQSRTIKRYLSWQCPKWQTDILSDIRDKKLDLISTRGGGRAVQGPTTASDRKDDLISRRPKYQKNARVSLVTFKAALKGLWIKSVFLFKLKRSDSIEA